MTTSPSISLSVLIPDVSCIPMDRCLEHLLYILVPYDGLAAVPPKDGSPQTNARFISPQIDEFLGMVFPSDKKLVSSMLFIFTFRITKGFVLISSSDKDPSRC